MNLNLIIGYVQCTLIVQDGIYLHNLTTCVRVYYGTELISLICLMFIQPQNCVQYASTHITSIHYCMLPAKL